MVIQKNLADVLSAQKSFRGLSMQEFADELGISRSYLQTLLKGEANPSLQTVEHISTILGLNPEEVLSIPFGQPPQRRKYPSGKESRRSFVEISNQMIPLCRQIILLGEEISTLEEEDQCS